MPWQADMLTELYATIEGVDAAVTIMRSQTAARISWRTMLEQFEASQTPNYAAPFVVVEAGRATPSDDFGDHNDAYECEVQIYGIWPRSVNGDRRSESEIEAEMEVWARDMRRALMSDSRTAFQVIRAESSWDTGIPPNAYFVRSKIPLTAVMVSAKLIGGDQ